MRSNLFILKSKKLPLLAGLLIAVFSLLAIASPSPQKVSAAGCSNSNDIMTGGFSNSTQFINTVNASPELQDIYASSDYGLTKGMYTNFKANAQNGYTTRNGDVFLSNGKKVGSGANSIGREAGCQGSGYFTTPLIHGEHFYGNTNDKAFASGTNSLPVMILMDSTGKAVFAAIKDCGNPVHFKPVLPPPPPPPAPVYNCVSLVGAILDKGNNTYRLTVTVSYDHGAKPVSADFVYGDGSSQNGVGMTGQTLSVTHAYPNMNTTYVAVATVNFLASGKAVSDTSPGCRAPVPVTIPFCKSLSGAIIDASKYEAQFTATATLNGRVLTSADFNFGDGKIQNGVTPNTNTTVRVVHDYPMGGKTFNAVATLHFALNGHSYTAPACRALVSPKVILSECKPGVPIGNAACNPCPSDSSLPADSKDCVPPQTTLPNTGAGNTIAIFSTVVVGGFLIYRQVIYRQHKAAFVAAERGTSPLPLADATDDVDPLRDTPLEPTRSTLRRRRPF